MAHTLTDMRFRPLGRSGLIVSAVGLGCNNFGWHIDQDASRDVVEAALDAGVTLFDTADVYGGDGGSERILGGLLEGRRDQVVLATKFGMDMHGSNGNDYGARGSRRYIRRAVAASLRRLRTDYIDLYQYHRPDGITPIEETLEAMSELVTEGKVRYIGTSNFPAWLVAETDWLSRTRGLVRFISAQNHYNLLDRSVEVELTPACERYGIAILPYYPLASGLLTGKYRRGEGAPGGARLASWRSDWLDTADFDRIEALEAFGAQVGRSLLELAIGGLGAQRAVSSVIAGATSAKQVYANVAAGSWEPTADELERLNHF
jgi:aryl-alcohol dehydrogenase-like predicted oxidoreductase